MKILLDMRAALDGHSGIPQETRLLFRGLGRLEGIEPVGLIQSGNLVLASGLSLRRRASSPASHADGIDRLSRVVISLQQGPASMRAENLRRRFVQLTAPVGAGLASLFGKVSLTGFDPTHFKDFVWRSMFAKSLPVEDFDAVTAAEYRVLRWPRSAVNAVGIATAALGHALYPRIDTTGIDVMIAETPFPGRVSGRTRMVVRYHDAVPLLMPHTVKGRSYDRAMHYHALRRNARDGAWFACVSEATRQDLLAVLPEVEPRSVTIPNMISHHFLPESAPADRVGEIVWSRKNRQAPHEGGAPIAAEDVVGGTPQYLLMVSTLEPRKNHLALLDAWELLRHAGHPRLHLICVGSLGWDHGSTMQRFAPWLRRGGLHLLEGVPAADLRLLYRHASATVCPSFSEGFDFSGIEAMRSGGVVAASDIRVHRDIYGSAAEYFNPYSAEDIAATVGRLIDPAAEARRAVLRDDGAQVSAQYLPDVVLSQWREFLQRVAV